MNIAGETKKKTPSSLPHGSDAAFRQSELSGTPGFAVEGLESRALMSSGPLLTGVQLMGHLTAINAVVMTFNESLDPTTAQNHRRPMHSAGRRWRTAQAIRGLSIGDFLPFREIAAVQTGCRPGRG